MPSGGPPLGGGEPFCGELLRLIVGRKMPSNSGQERLAGQRVERCVRHRDDVGHPGGRVEQRDLAEDLAPLEGGQFPSIAMHTDRAIRYQVELVAMVALSNDQLARPGV